MIDGVLAREECEAAVVGICGLLVLAVVVLIGLRAYFP